MQRLSRKMEHLHHAVSLQRSGASGLSDLAFVPNSIPESSFANIQLNTSIGGIPLASPIIINAMTGGAPETERVNRDLAVAARERNLAMAVGSQMAAIKQKDLADSYRVVRKENPHGVIFANLGSEATVPQAIQAIEMIEADGLQIHLNVMQELIMPEGDRDFRGMLERIEAIIQEVNVPVIVKEVGFGMTRQTARKLRKIGVNIVDVGGFGGTNFAKIENERRVDSLDWLNDWGCSTAASLLETLPHYKQGGCVIASGGIENSLDIAKVLALGASAAGMAGALLCVQQTDGVDALIRHIGELEHGLKVVMTALGTNTIAELQEVPIVITGRTKQWCDERGIDTATYARKDISG